MLTLFWFGLLLGWGAAIPIGPINLEAIRRNLRFGLAAGLALGFGACSADLTYLILLSIGLLNTLAHPVLIKVLGILGSLVLAWFGISALRAAPNKGKHEQHPSNRKRSLIRHYAEGYALTLINPMTLLFWSSVSVTIALKTQAAAHAVVYAGLGVLVGTTSWISTLNLFVHQTRHRLTDRAMRLLNLLGGIILLGFAAVNLFHALFHS